MHKVKEQPHNKFLLMSQNTECLSDMASSFVIMFEGNWLLTQISNHPITWEQLISILTSRQPAEVQSGKGTLNMAMLWYQTGWSEYFRNWWSAGIFLQTLLGFRENVLKKRKYPVGSSSLCENVLLTPEVSRDWTGCSELIGGQQ